MKRSRLVASAVFALSITPHSAFAWENHALGTALALSPVLEVQRFPAAPAESLFTFLKKEQKGLAQVLDQEEEWARQNVPTYPPRPESLRWDFKTQTQNELDLRKHFLHAIRVNPNMEFPLFVQKVEGVALARGLPLANQGSGRSPVKGAVVISGAVSAEEQQGLIQVREGQPVDAWLVIATASSEPDYGIDIGLWEDNGTEAGRMYGFGKQPFGNPSLAFGTQAPFHMGFFHESKIAYKASARLSRTYPEYRNHLFTTLARYAFMTGHPYWGLRFAGWALHYVQDLTQPYHTTVFPGVSLMRMLLLNGMDLLGIHFPLKNQIQLVTNEHLALENYAFYSLIKGLEIKGLGEQHSSNPILLALKNTDEDSTYPSFTSSSLRNAISLESHELAQRTHDLLAENMPRWLVSDPAYLFGVTDPKINVLHVVETSAPKQNQQAIQAHLAKLFQKFGIHTRAFVQSILPHSSPKPSKDSLY